MTTILIQFTLVQEIGTPPISNGFLVWAFTLFFPYIRSLLFISISWLLALLLALNILNGQFYRVQVGLQSPEGATTVRGVLRRFNDFLKLFSDVSQHSL